jgi:hypothetical protein
VDGADLVLRIADDEELLRSHGIVIGAMWHDPDDGMVEVEVVAPDEAGAERVFKDRYGAAVRVDYCGTEETDVAPVGWERFELAAPDRLTIWFRLGSIHRSFEGVTVTEFEDEVNVTVFERYPVMGGEKMPMTPLLQADVSLDRPLGSRRVVDGASS